MGALSKIRTSASRDHANQPFITDCTHGLRTELSGTVFEQWVAKTTNWLESEFGAGLQLHVDLRPHWLWPVLVAALDELEGALVDLQHADALVCIGSRSEMTLPVIAVHDHPMAMPFREALPSNHLDFFREVRAGADTRIPGPLHDEPILSSGGHELTGDLLLALIPEIASAQRIAMHVGTAAVRSAQQVATIAVLPWATRSSLVIADGSSTIAGERTTVDVQLG